MQLEINITPDVWLRVKEVESYLKMSHGAVYQLLRNNPQIVTISLGERRSTRLVNKQSLKDFMAGRMANRKPIGRFED
jgi:hypothetical protein